MLFGWFWSSFASRNFLKDFWLKNSSRTQHFYFLISIIIPANKTCDQGDQQGDLRAFERTHKKIPAEIVGAEESAVCECWRYKTIVKGDCIQAVRACKRAQD